MIKYQHKIYPAAGIENDPPVIPLLTSIPAGWPSPAEDYIEDSLNLHQLIVRNPPATYFLRALGHSMIGAGINDGDLLVVDRSQPPKSGSIVVAAIDGELTIKRFIKRGSRLFLVPENPEFAEIDITDLEEADIWGVVTYAVHKF